MAKITSLTVHKNTRLQRHRKEVRDHMDNAVRTAKQEPELIGYALVTWTSTDGRKPGCTMADWRQRGPQIPTGTMGDFVRRAIERQENVMDTDARIAAALFGPDDDG